MTVKANACLSISREFAALVLQEMIIELRTQAIDDLAFKVNIVGLVIINTFKRHVVKVVEGIYYLTPFLSGFLGGRQILFA